MAGSKENSGHSRAAGQHPLVSVIVPTYNRTELLRELLLSLARQEWRPLEVIVVDDGSPTPVSATLDQAWVVGGGIELKVLRQSNKGPAAARNLGLSASSGRYVYFVDSDDLVERDGLRRMVDTLEESGAPYCVGQIRSVAADGSTLALNDGNLARIDYEGVLGSRWSVHGTLYRRTAIESAGRFDEQLERGEDSEFRWRVVASNPPGMMIDGVVATYRRHDQGQATDRDDSGATGRSVLASVEAFCAWAESNGGLRPQMARRATRLLLTASIRLGAAGDWRRRKRAVALARELQAGVPAGLRWPAGFPYVEAQTVFRGLELLSRLVRRLVHLRRNREFRRSM